MSDTSIAPFRDSHPIDFSLLDDNEQSVLYIDDDPSDHSLTLELINRSHTVIQGLNPNGATDASPDFYHFELRFHPGTLSPSTLQTLQRSDRNVITLGDQTDWKITTATATSQSGVDSIFLISTNHDFQLQPEERISITIRNLTASATLGAHSTQIELKFKNLAYPNNATPLDGHRLKHIHIANHRGRKHIPLHLGFKGSNRVINYNGISNDLTLRIANVLKLDPENPSKSSIRFDNNSRFILSFDVQADGEDKDWALCKAGETGDIGGNVNGIPFVEGALQGQSPEVIISPAAIGNQRLDAGEHLEINITGIKSSLPTGHSNVYVRYENIPGYWDGQFVCVVEKMPLLFSNHNVGIGVKDPTHQLEVDGSIVGQNLSVALENDKRGTLFLATKGDYNHALYNNYNDNDQEGEWDGAKWNVFDGLKIRAGADSNKRLALAINKQGNVGIGLENQKEKLEVDGNVVGKNFALARDYRHRGILYLSTTGDMNHALYSNYSNQDGEGRWDGAKWNVYTGLRVRTGSAGNRLALSIDSYGNVGLGVTSPRAKLHVSGGKGSAEVLIEADTDNVGEYDQPRLTLSQDKGTVSGQLGFFNGKNQLTLKNVYTDSLHLGTGDRDRITISGHGHVTVHNQMTVSHTLNLKSNLHVNGSKPFVHKTYKLLWKDNQKIYTGYRDRDWTAVIAGFNCGSGDGDIEGIKVLPVRRNNYWYIECDMRGTSSEYYWNISVMFIRNELVHWEGTFGE